MGIDSNTIDTHECQALRSEAQMPKPQLPPEVYSMRGRPRLALLTCGGRFLESIGHHRDNVVVIPIPV